MRTVHELIEEELEELRERYYYLLEEVDKDIFYSYSSHEDIPMSEITTHYEGTYFVEDDFWCNE
jgi:hypothetical protein